MAAMYSVSQVLILEGRARIAHGLHLILILTVMGALMERAEPLARMIAIPLILAAFWLLVVEPRCYRIFPLLVIAFSALLIAGYVQMG